MSRERIDRARLQAQAPLGPVGGQSLDLGLLGDLAPERLDERALAGVGDEGVDQGMLGREHGVGHPERGVRARGEDDDLHVAPTRHRQLELGAVAAADPVPLHRHHPLRPTRQPVAPVQELLGIVRDLEEPALDLLDLDLGLAPPAASALDLLVGEDGLAGRAPVDAGALLVGQAPLEHPDEDELLPPVIGRVAGRHLAIPVVGDAHAPELGPHVLDVLVGPHGGVDAVLDGGVLGGESEGVPPHRVQHVEPAHPLEARQEIADRIDPHVSHVDTTGRVGKHLEAVELRAGRILGGLELLGLLPGPLPLHLELAKGIAIVTVVERHVTADS